MEDAVLGMPAKARKTLMIKIQFRLASLDPLEIELLIEWKLCVDQSYVFRARCIFKWSPLPDTRKLSADNLS